MESVFGIFHTLLARDNKRIRNLLSYILQHVVNLLPVLALSIIILIEIALLIGRNRSKTAKTRIVLLEQISRC